MASMSVTITSLRISRCFATAVVKPHVPMIKFRKGQSPIISDSQAPVTPQTEAVAAPGVYEWWEVPGRFKRGSIDQTECDVINMGGGDKLW